MSEGGSAPAATGGAAPAAPAAPSTPGAATQGETPSWSEKDDATLFETVKRAPWAKYKVDGKEVSISSPDDIKRLIVQSQRAGGAQKIAEEAKREKAEAAAAREEAKAIKQALDAARRGDAEALRALGLIPDDERQKAEEEWSKLPPQVQQILRQNEEYRSKLQELADREAKTLKEQEESKKKAERDSQVKQAKEWIAELLTDIDPKNLDHELPDVLSVLESLRASGLRNGRDYTKDHFKALLTEARESRVFSQVARMKPEAMLSRLGPQLATVSADQLETALGEHFVPFAKAVSAAWLKHHKRGGAAKQAQPVVEAEKKPAEPQRQAKPLFPWSR